jgi:hypothetical protein
MNTQLPVHLQGRQSRGLARRTLDNIPPGTPASLSIEGSRFTLIDAAGGVIPIQTLYIDCIVVDANEHVSQTYYDPDAKYDPNTPSPPLCFSDNGVGPSIQAREPQSTTCAACPKQAWEKINALGNKVPWCQKSQKIALWPFEYSTGLFMLKIPPATMFKNWRDYMKKFETAGMDPDWVVTRISFEGTGVLQFQSPGYVSPEQTSMVGKMLESKATDALVGRLDRPRQGALPAPQEETRPLPPQSLPAGNQTPMAGPAADSQTPAAGEPVRRRGRRAANQAPAPTPQQAPFAPTQAQATQPQPAPFVADPPPSQGNSQFGITQNPPAPPAGLDLDAVFK